MTIECSFSPEFWLAEGEPYDRTDLALNSKGQPVSVYSAICQALETSEAFKDDVRTLLEVENVDLPDDVLADELFSRATQVNLCDDYRVPVNVYLDEECSISVAVYDER